VQYNTIRKGQVSLKWSQFASFIFSFTERQGVVWLLGGHGRRVSPHRSFWSSEFYSTVQYEVKSQTRLVLGRVTVYKKGR